MNKIKKEIKKLMNKFIEIINKIARIN